MSSQEERVRVILIQAIRGLDPSDPACRAFEAARRFRQKHATPDEKVPGVSGLKRALERALALFNQDTEISENPPDTDVTSSFIEDLAKAAMRIDRSVLRTFIRDIGSDHVLVPGNELAMRPILRAVLAQYAKSATCGLIPGP